MAENVSFEGWKLYYTQDGLGSVRTLSDGSGATVNTYDYSAFGETYAPRTVVGVTNRYQYTGREKSGVSGLQYNRWRMYDAGVGRWLKRDPQSYSDGPNIYAYVRNRANVGKDPMGLWLGSGHESLTNFAINNYGVLKSRLASGYKTTFVDGNVDTDKGYSATDWFTIGFTSEEAVKHYMTGIGDTPASAKAKAVKRIKYYTALAKKRWERGINATSKVERTKYCKLGWTYFGTAMHTAQDKFSHTDDNYNPLTSSQHGGTFSGWSTLIPVYNAYKLLGKWEWRDTKALNSKGYRNAEVESRWMIMNVISAADGKKGCNCIEAAK